MSIPDGKEEAMQKANVIESAQEIPQVVQLPIAVIETGTESCSGERQGILVTLPAPLKGDAKAL